MACFLYDFLWDLRHERVKGATQNRRELFKYLESILDNSLQNYISVVVLPLESLVQVALRKEPAIAPFVEHFKIRWEGLTGKFTSTFLEGSIKNYILILVFLKEGLVQLPLRKALVIAPFVGRFKEMSPF